MLNPPPPPKKKKTTVLRSLSSESLKQETAGRQHNLVSGLVVLVVLEAELLVTMPDARFRVRV